MERLRALYVLTKPGIVRGNAIHVIAGVLLASSSGIDWSVLLGVLAGTSLVIASACVVNNYMDRKIDARMKRTKHRPSVTGTVPLAVGAGYATFLFIAGMTVLYLWTSWAVMALGAIAYVTYVLIYGWAKRTTVHSTLIGAIPGALPAMAGYVAVSGEITLGAWLVFLLVFVWQMPHFYAISIFRKDEYRAARLPVLGVIRPFPYVKRTMIVYMLAYAFVVAAMIHFAVVGPPAGLLLLAGSAYWIATFFVVKSNDEAKWARAVFGASLVLTLALLVASLLNVYVPPVV